MRSQTGRKIMSANQNATLTKELIKVRAMSIKCADHPEWGSFGVMDDNGEYLTIQGQGGRMVLHYDEMRFWQVIS